MDWKVVTKGSKSRIRSHKLKCKANYYKVSYISYQSIISKCKSDKDYLEMKSNLLNSLSRPLVAVGIGNFSQSLYSTSQQALFESLSIGGELVFDPEYSNEEIEYLANAGFIVNSGDFTDRSYDEVTFFMVHCHFSLYEKLLAQDWISTSRVVIFGNSVLAIREKIKDLKALENAEMFSESRFVTDDMAFSDTYICKNF